MAERLRHHSEPVTSKYAKESKSLSSLTSRYDVIAIQDASAHTSLAASGLGPAAGAVIGIGARAIGGGSGKKSCIGKIAAAHGHLRERDGCYRRSDGNDCRDAADRAVAQIGHHATSRSAGTGGEPDLLISSGQISCLSPGRNRWRDKPATTFSGKLK
ncbi:hypothetical protein [Paraburkholderia sp. MM5477-R1]|uniref:hypothetical protein n=1 Tax=Paraburkholderia sp. MM5477-R1 TaxID=2991062 RepID=UPI003D20B2C3